MVRLQAALTFISLLLASNAESDTLRSSSTPSQFRSAMRKVLRDKNAQKLQMRMLKRVEDKIASKSKGIRKLDEYYQADEAENVENAEYYAKEEAVSNETEYYSAEEEEVTYYSSKEYYVEEEEDQANVEYYAEEEEEEEVEEETYYNKAWGHDDNYDHDGLSFDLSKFSLKMHSCRSLTDFELESLSQEQIEEKEYERDELKEISYPFSGVPYVSYRLCPTSTCRDDDWKGCRKVYGNYMITLEDYFEITEQHLEEELEEYCDYCKQCNYFYKFFNATCQYYSECEAYKNVCYDNDGDDGAEQIDYQELLECTAVEKSYYKQYYNRRTEEGEEYEENVYLKIFCDGSIKIGIFSDDECTNYIGETTTIYQSTGMKVLEDDLETDFMNHDCIHCGKNNHKYYAMNRDKYDEKQNADDDQEDEDEIYDICEVLYEDSAKCNKFLPEPAAENENGYYQYYQKYYGYDEDWEQTKNPTSCAYMEAFQKNNIDKYGFVHLSYNQYFKYFINKMNNDILPAGYFITDKQFFAIIGATIFCLAVMVYGCTKPKRKIVFNKELKATLV